MRFALCVVLVALAVSVSASVKGGDNPCAACVADAKKGWCVSTKACVDVKELAPKGSCPTEHGVFVAENCPKAESAVKCDSATVKKVMADIIAGVEDDTKKLGTLDAAAAEKLVAEIMKTVSLFYDTTSKGATDLYYCTFGPYASGDLKPTVEKARAAVKALMAAVEAKFGKDIDKAHQDLATAAAPAAAGAAAPAPKAPKFLQLHERLLHKRALSHNPLALIEAESRVRVWDWVANLYNWAASVWGWVPYWQGHMQPAHCAHGGQLFPGCAGAPRAFAQTVANCGVPMNPAAAAAGPCADWFSGNGACPAAGGPKVPAGPAPAILGPGAAINAICGVANGAAYVNDCRAQNFNKLHLWNPNWSECVNLQWSYCGAQGALPKQGGANVRVLVPPRQWNVAGPNLRITQMEMCALSALCTNNAQLWQANADFVFACNPVAGGQV